MVFGSAIGGALRGGLAIGGGGKPKMPSMQPKMAAIGGGKPDLAGTANKIAGPPAKRAFGGGGKIRTFGGGGKIRAR